jgi:hypothetical protein
MIVFGPPPAPPGWVVFEETVSTETQGTVSRRQLNFVSDALEDTMQIQVVNDTATTVQINSKGISELRAVHTSLNKKARQERMSKLEREYPW